MIPTNTKPWATGFLLLGIMLVPAFPGVLAQQAESDPAVDPYGDPLPDGARLRLGSLRWRHSGPVSFVGFAQDGKQLVTASQDGTIRLWDRETGKEIRRFGKTPNPPAANQLLAFRANLLYANAASDVAALSPDGNTLLVATPNGTIALYEVASGKELGQFRVPQGVAGGLLFAPDGKTVFTRGGDLVIRQCDIASRKEVRQFASKQPVNRVGVYNNGGNNLAVSPDGHLLAVAGLELEGQMLTSMIRLWELDSGKELTAIKAPTNNGFQSTSPVFSPDSKSVAWIQPNDGTIRFSDVETGKEVRQIARSEQAGNPVALAFSPDGTTLAAKGAEAVFQLWDVRTGKELRRLGEGQPVQGNVQAGRNFNRSMAAFAFSPDGTTLAAGSGENAVRLWDVETGKEVLPMGGHQGSVAAIHVSADGKTVVTRGADNTLRQWDRATGKELRQVKLSAPAILTAFSPDGVTLASVATDNTVRLLDVSSGKELHQLPLPGGVRFAGFLSITGVAFSPDGKLLAARGYDQLIRLWDVASGKELRALSEPAGPNRMAARSPFYQQGATGLAFSPDGSTLAAVNGRGGNSAGVVRFWHVASGKPVREIDTGRPVAAFAFSPDGRNLVTANGDNTLSVWEVLTGQERHQFKGSAAVLAFSADGRVLAAGGVDQKVHLWDMWTGKALAEFPGHEGAILSVAFAPDNSVISGSADTTATVWDSARFFRGPSSQPVELEVEQVQEIWSVLAQGDAKKAWQAIQSFRADPRQAAWLDKHLTPAVGVDPQRLAQLIVDLDSDSFAVRSTAAEALEQLGELAEPILKETRASQPALELRVRVERLLALLLNGQPPAPDLLQALRAIEVLEKMGTPEARAVLEKLAQGARGAKLTRAAEGAMKRVQ